MLLPPVFLLASAAVPVSPAEDFPCAVLGPANPPRSCPAQTERPSVVNSKTAASGCCATSDTHRAPRPSPDVPGNRAGHHRVRGCNALRRNRDRGNVPPLYVVAGICRLRIAGRAEWPITFFPPRWISCEALGQDRWDSSALDLTEGLLRFKRWIAHSPLTLTLSPLRGEGTAFTRRGNVRASIVPPAHKAFRPDAAGSHATDQRIQVLPPAASLSPQRGEGLRVRGESGK